MRTWSDRPFGATVAHVEVATLASVIAEAQGESSIIYEIGGHAGWLAKIHKTGTRTEPVTVLDRLIALPGGMERKDLAVVDSRIAWPVSRIVDGTRTVGVVMAKAPECYSAEVALLGGRTKRIQMELDHLVMPPAEFTRRGLRTPTLAERLTVVRQLLTVGELFERYQVVYGDWSYANAFWAPSSNQIMIIDVDSAGLTTRGWVESNAWNDPLVQTGERLDTFTDRYKLAVLALRCLTGVRDLPGALEAIPVPLLDSQLEGKLRRSLETTRRSLRPSAADLLRALDLAARASQPSTHLASDSASASNVTGWVPAPRHRPPGGHRQSRPSGHSNGTQRPVTTPSWHQPRSPTPDPTRRHSPADPSPRPSQDRDVPVGAKIVIGLSILAGTGVALKILAALVNAILP